MDLVGEDEMKDRAGRNQPRERSQSMKNRKKGQRERERADGIEARGRLAAPRREDSAGSRYRINEAPLMGAGEGA